MALKRHRMPSLITSNIKTTSHPAPRQENLLRKYLSYNEPSRAAVSVADLTMAITRDVPELVQEGFMALSQP